MRVVIAPDKFKGSLDAAGVAEALAAGFLDVVPDAQCVLVPMADGGDGTVDAFIAAGAAAHTVRVAGPLGAPVDAVYARDGATAVIEMAAASGLALLGAGLDARRATTRGTGALLRAALDGGAERIVLGLGGSATTDGGAGALLELGVRFFDDDDGELGPEPADIARVARVDLDDIDPRLRTVDLALACDVDNPLLGPRGAAAVYGPQKGAAGGDVAFLDAALARLADAMRSATGRDLRDVAGAGAAGGLGWGLASACGARLERGVAVVAEVRGLASALFGADLCLTGEGRIDVQTLHGKVIAGVAMLANGAGVPVIAFGGSVELAAEAALRERGIRCIPIVPGPLSLEAAMRDVSPNLRAAAARVAALLFGER